MRISVSKIIIPTIVFLVALGWFSFDQTLRVMNKTSKQKSELISGEIHQIFTQKELALEGLENELEAEMKRLSNRLINYYFSGKDSLENVNIDSIRNVLGVDTALVDLYVINGQGLVLQTTMKSDMNLNLFSFGPQFTEFLKERFEDGSFYSSRFGIEIKTNKIKKYSYEKTGDGKYMIEIGHYSPRADEIIVNFERRLDSIAATQPGILDVELYVDDHNPLTLNKANNLSAIHRRVLRQTFDDQRSHTLVEIEEGKKVHYEYIYSREEGEPEKFASVVRIKSNKSIEEKILRNTLYKALLTFAFIILVLIVLLILVSRNYQKPIKYIISFLTEGLEKNDFDSLEIRGSKLIGELTEKINTVITKLSKAESKLDTQSSTIEEQKDQIKAKSEGMVDSLRYAKKIQSALFPSDVHVHSIFPKTLLYYKPKSVVSGDFYWMEEHDGIKYFAIVDCTGHGVTGAFISLVGLNSLNRTIREFNIKDPAAILNKVNELLEATLQQKDADIKDGMDIALCAYSQKDKKLFYCGANSPVILTRKTEMGNMIINKSWSEPDDAVNNYGFYELKGNRKSIGGIDVKEEEFKTTVVEIKEGDTIYLFTDGISDQIGGPDGKKFRSKNFRQMIKDIQGNDIPDQKELIDKRINDWMQDGKYEQIDDMCLIAVQFND